MPAVIRRLVIVAAVDGLILQPLHQRNQRALKLDYRSGKLSTTEHFGNIAGANSLDCHGIVGLLRIPLKSYLIAISGRQQVGQIRGFPIYVITDVALIPTGSQAEAKKAILQTKEALKREAGGAEDDQSDSDFSEVERELDEKEDVASHGSPESIESIELPSPEKELPDAARTKSTIVEDVIGRKGQYGRFAERWFSKKGWTAERRKTQGMSPDTNPAPTPPDLTSKATAQDTASGIDETRSKEPAPDVTSTLLPKFLRTARILFASRSFFYSYDIDITRRLETLPPKQSDLPLHKSIDPLYFWNRHLASPFMDGNHGAFILPVMQGFVGQRAFVLDKEQEASEIPLPTEADESEKLRSNFLVTLVSRRSTKRPGLRYVRRGLDDDGHAANSVETEQILSKGDWSGTTYSFAQTRASIPLFFSQSPYSFKPVPVLQNSPSRNQAAFDRHFNDLKERYGGVQITSLVDKSGGEAAIGQKFEDTVGVYNSRQSDNADKLDFEWFDFHNICRGMKFENVSLLIDKVRSNLDKFRWAEENDGSIVSKQKGIFRVNCMDCLDRTNVVQSAFGQQALEAQLKIEGFKIDLQTDVTTQWFNTLWADNGDAISKQYSSTAALKGDFTRTRKRNYKGAINDLGLTLSRYYNNIVNDYFSQASIDFLLGNVNIQVFEEFEDKLMSGDPGMSLQKVRENAISTCSKIVIKDGSEDSIGGWVLLSPSRSNTLGGTPLEEVILLLTDAALYKVRFDWNNEKVVSFERVDLRSVIGITKGTYVTSTLTAAQMNESSNVGFVIKYRPGKEDIARVNTRSLSTSAGMTDTETERKISGDAKAIPVKIMPFKALPAVSSSTTEGEYGRTANEMQRISSLCDDIERATLGSIGPVDGFIEEQPIISLTEARKNTGYVDQLGHALKRLVWG